MLIDLWASADYRAKKNAPLLPKRHLKNKIDLLFTSVAFLIRQSRTLLSLVIKRHYSLFFFGRQGFGRCFQRIRLRKKLCHSRHLNGELS